MRPSVLVCGLLAITGCAAGCQAFTAPEDPCEAVGERVRQLLRRAESGGLADRQLARKLEHTPGDLTHRCRTEGWSTATRACFTGATQLRQLFMESCDPAPTTR